MVPVGTGAEGTSYPPGKANVIAKKSCGPYFPKNFYLVHTTIFSLNIPFFLFTFDFCFSYFLYCSIIGI